MNNKKIVLASLFGVAVLTMGIATYAYQGNPGIQNLDCTDTERHAAVTDMFANKDYDSFKELYADKGVIKRISSEDQFLKFVELHEAGLSGDTDKVNELKIELNLGQKRRDGTGNANGMRGNRDWSKQGKGGRWNK